MRLARNEESWGRGAGGSGLGGSAVEDLGAMVALGAQGLGALRVAQPLDDVGEIA